MNIDLSFPQNKLEKQLKNCTDTTLCFKGQLSEALEFFRYHNIPSSVTRLDLSSIATSINTPQKREVTQQVLKTKGEDFNLLKIKFPGNVDFQAIFEVAKQLDREEDFEEYCYETHGEIHELNIYRLERLKKNRELSLEVRWQLIKRTSSLDLDEEDKAEWICRNKKDSSWLGKFLADEEDSSWLEEKLIAGEEDSSWLGKFLAGGAYPILDMLETRSLENTWKKLSEAQHTAGLNFQGIEEKEAYIREFFPNINDMEKKQKGCNSVVDSLYQLQLKIIYFTKKIEEIEKSFSTPKDLKLHKEDDRKKYTDFLKRCKNDTQKFTKAKEVTQRLHHYLKDLTIKLDGSKEMSDDLKLQAGYFLDGKSDPDVLIKALGLANDQIKDETYLTKLRAKTDRKSLLSLIENANILRQHRGIEKIIMTFVANCILLVPLVIASVIKGRSMFFKATTDTGMRADNLSEAIKKMGDPKQK